MPVHVRDVMRELKELGSPQNVKVYKRHGVKGPLYGVSYAQLRPMAKRLGKDNVLAEALWQSGNHDARVLACMVGDPASFPEAMADAWVCDLNNYIASDEFAKLVASAPYAQKKIKAWTRSPDEWIANAGWVALSVYAVQNPLPKDAYFLEFIDTIRDTIHTRRNRVRHAMNQALIAIGIRNDALQKAAIEAARSIGKVEVDHGETNCVTPDAESYILKTVARRKRIADGKMARAKSAVRKKA